jgi:signal transduction histidine kinase
MRSLVASLDGAIEITSTPGEGTVVRCAIPA